MSAPTIKVWEEGERITIEDLNDNFAGLQQMFGALSGTDLLYPFIMSGDIDMSGNRVLRARETFSIINVAEIGLDEGAFEDAISELSNGGIIFIPRNTTMLIDTSIRAATTKDRVVILGCGFSSQIQMKSGADTDAIVFDGADNVRLSHVYINGTNTINSAGTGVVLKNCDDFEISNCWIGSTSSTGVVDNAIECTGCSDFTIKKVWIRHPGKRGIQLRNCTNFIVSQATIRNGGSDGILVDECSDGVVEASRVATIQREGIIVSQSNSIRVAHNSVDDYANETTLDDLGGISVFGKNVSFPSDGVVVTGNSVSNGGDSGVGILIGSWVYGSVIANYARINVRPMKYFGGKDSRVSFRDNAVMDKDHHGTIEFLAGAATTQLDLGVTGLPVSAIHATWNESTNFSSFVGSVLGAKYSGQLVTFYNASALPTAKTIWYTLEV